MPSAASAQDPTDEVFSAGWVGVPHTVGVNGGVLLLHAARARKWQFARVLASVTHAGARLRERGQLDGFCDLAEQDTINLALARSPELWRPLDCSWNYMATNRGGHRMEEAEPRTPTVYYDGCATPPPAPMGVGE